MKGFAKRVALMMALSVAVGSESIARVLAKRLRVGDALTAGTQTLDCGKDFLKDERQVFGPADIRLRRHG